jgi:hypothetical protein
MNATREELLFALAPEKPADKRAAFLEVMCDGDSPLRQRLEELKESPTDEDLLKLLRTLNDSIQ